MNQPRHSPVRQGDVFTVTNRLTERDSELINILGEHQVLTSHQIARGFFGSPERARARCAILHHLDVLARFRPPRPSGSNPYHYTLGYTGACLHAAARSAPWPKRGTITEQATRIAHSPKLAHTLGVNDFFTHLMRHTRNRGLDLLWHNETHAAEHTGGMVKPDAHATITAPDTRIEFYYEHDTGSEDHGRLVAKLDRYRHLATQLPILIELSGPVRENNLHHALNDRAYPFAVATTHTVLTPRPDHPTWWPLHRIGRRSLTDIPTIELP